MSNDEFGLRQIIRQNSENEIVRTLAFISYSYFVTGKLAYS